MRVFAESELYRKHAGLGDGRPHDGGGRRRRCTTIIKVVGRMERQRAHARRASTSESDDVTLALQELSESPSALGAPDASTIGSMRDLVKKLEDDRFHLVVVGEFNHGKIDAS